jgi:SAM-dependent methyltransferase/predicted transcriptional regulator
LLVKLEDIEVYKNERQEIFGVVEFKRLVKRDKVTFICKRCNKKSIYNYPSIREKYFQPICKFCWNIREPQEVDRVILAKKESLSLSKIGELVGLSKTSVMNILDKYEKNECYKFKMNDEEIKEYVASLPLYKKTIYDLSSNDYSIKDNKLYIKKRKIPRNEKIMFKCERCNTEYTIRVGHFIDKKYTNHICPSCRMSISHSGFKHSESSIEKMKRSVRERGVYIDKWEDRECPECKNKFSVRVARCQKKQKYCSEDCRVKAFSKIGSKQGKYGKLGPASVQYPSKPEMLFANYLDSKNISYEQHYSLFNKSFDFKLSDDSLIEVDGDYWHKNDGVEITRIKQIKKVVVDKEKEIKCTRAGYQLYRIWESKIINGDFEYKISNRNFEWDEIFIRKEWLLSLDKKKLEKIVPLLVRWTRAYFPKFTVKYKESNLEQELSSVRGDQSRNRDTFWEHPHTSLIGGNNFLKNRFISYWKGKKGSKESIYDAWGNEAILEKIIRYRVGLNAKRETFDISAKNILRGFISGNYAISWFSPSLACEIYKRIGDIESVYDPCCGFGARALGLKACGGKYYYGIDYNEETVKENKKLLEEIKLEGEILCDKAEDHKPNMRFDLAFTCPPYFNSEKYSKDMIPYKDVSSEFLYPTIENMLDVAKKVVLVVNRELKEIIDSEYPNTSIVLKNKKSHFKNYKNEEYILFLK